MKIASLKLQAMLQYHAYAYTGLKDDLESKDLKWDEKLLKEMKKRFKTLDINVAMVKALEYHSKRLERLSSINIHYPINTITDALINAIGCNITNLGGGLKYSSLNKIVSSI